MHACTAYVSGCTSHPRPSLLLLVVRGWLNRGLIIRTSTCLHFIDFVWVRTRRQGKLPSLDSILQRYRTIGIRVWLYNRLKYWVVNVKWDKATGVVEEDGARVAFIYFCLRGTWVRTVALGSAGNVATHRRTRVYWPRGFRTRVTRCTIVHGVRLVRTRPAVNCSTFLDHDNIEFNISLVFNSRMLVS